MDLTQAAQSGLSVGFHSSPIPIQLQLLDQKQETRIDNEDNQAEDEQFSILGHQVCIKRPRDNSSQSSSTTNSFKRVARIQIECASPFDYCDIVTSTTHKSLRGPRGGIIFYRKGPKLRKQGMLVSHSDGSSHYDFEEKINFAVHPSTQGGPHNNHIAALAIALKQVATPEYKAYMQLVRKNAQALASALLRRKCRLVTGGTDNHLLLWDLTTWGLTGKCYEKVCEMCNITLNKSAIFGDNGAICPGGVRIGTPAMTSRGCLEADFETIADFLHKAAQITTAVRREHGKKDFLKGLHNNKDIVELRNRVEIFASQFAMPGFDI